MMDKYEAAIAEITDRAEHSLKTKLSADTAAIAIETLRAQAERDKMRCENCKSLDENQSQKDDRSKTVTHVQLAGACICEKNVLQG